MNNNLDTHQLNQENTIPKTYGELKAALSAYFGPNDNVLEKAKLWRDYLADEAGHAQNESHENYCNNHFQLFNQLIAHLETQNHTEDTRRKTHHALLQF